MVDINSISNEELDKMLDKSNKEYSDEELDRMLMQEHKPLVKDNFLTEFAKGINTFVPDRIQKPIQDVMLGAGNYGLGPLFGKQPLNEQDMNELSRWALEKPEGVGGFIGANLPYMLIPEAKFGKAPKYMNMILNGGLQGGVSGGVEALKEHENPIIPTLIGGVSGLGLSTALSGIPMVAGGLKRIGETLPPALLNFVGVNPRTFRYAKGLSEADANMLLSHPEFMANKRNLNILASQFADNINNYKKALSKQYGDIIAPFESSGEFKNELIKPEEIQTQLYNILKENRLVNESNKPTALGNLSNYNKLDEFVKGYSGSAEDVANLRRDLDKQFIRWNKNTENPTASESAVMNSAKSLRNYLDESLKNIEFEGTKPYNEADILYKSGMGKLKTPSIEQAYKAVKANDNDKLGQELLGVIKNKYQGYRDLLEFERAFKKLAPDIAKPVSGGLKAYNYADIMPSVDKNNTQFLNSAVKRALARPLVEEIALPISRNKLYQQLTKSIGKGLGIINRANLNKLIPFIMNTQPLQGGIEYNEY